MKQNQPLDFCEISKKIIENTTIPIVCLGLDSTIMMMNHAAAEKFGIDPDRVMGKKLVEFKPELAQRFGHKFQEIHETGQGQSFEDYIDFSKGECWYNIDIQPLIDENKKTFAFQVVCQDVTERKKIKDALSESEEKFSKAYYSNSNAMIISRLEDGKILEVNDRMLEIFGFERDEIIGKTSGELNVYKDIKERDRMRTEVKEKGFVRDFQVTHQTKRGEIRHALLSVDTIQIKNEPYILTVLNDITRLKQAEQSLKDSELKFKMITASANDGIALMDHNGNVSYWNIACEKMFGFKKEEVIGRQLHKLIVPEQYNEAYQKGFKKFAETGEGNAIGKRLELISKRKDGTKFPVELSLSAIKIKDKWNSVGVIRDISERKEYEDRLEVAKIQAESANRAKSEFIANMSHEIRTPMNAILGFSEVLHKKIEEPKYKKYLKTILNSGRALLTLIDDILDISKIEAGRLDIVNDPVSLKHILKDIIRIIAQKAKEKNLVFEVSVNEVLPKTLMLDEIRIRQILFNLLGNAVKFTENGYVRLRVDCITRSKINKVDLVFEVHDTGIGVPKSQQELIFDAFQQQRGQSARRYGGTGLGLSITKRLVEKMNGDVSVESEEGEGAIFRVNLYDVEIGESILSEAKEEQDEEQIIIKPSTIMIIDDIEFNIEMLKTLIDDFNISFIEAGSGEEALQILKIEKPDLIFMDLRLEGMTGFHTTEKIKGDASLKHIPVIAYTASAMKSDEKYLNELFDDHLQKPIDRKKLIRVLKRFLPYRLKKDTEQEEAQVIIPREMKEKLPQLVKELTEEHLPKWEEIRDSLVIYDIEKFINSLKKAMSDYHIEIIDHYCESFSNNIQSMDVDNIEKDLKEFPSVVNKIKTLFHRGF